MKTSPSNLIVIVAISAVVLSASSAVAGNNKNKQRKNSQSNSQTFRFGQGGAIFDLIEKLKKQHKDNDKDKEPQDVPPIDPGKGDGKPTTPTQPPKMPGYVWVNDHWERERAPQGSVSKPPIAINPMPGTIVVRDHRDQPGDTWKPTFNASQAPGGVIVTSGSVVVRDHRTGATNGQFVIRDHRTDSSNAPGGVTVTSGKPRPKNNGGGIFGAIGDAAGAVGNGISSAAGTVGKGLGNAAGAVGDSLGNAAGTAGQVLGINRGNKPSNGVAQGTTWSTPQMQNMVIRDHRK
jgi:hypothetical protein